MTFASGSSWIADSQTAAVGTMADEVRRIVAENPEATFIVEGFTDSSGSPAANQRISQRRAETLSDALAQATGLPRERFAATGLGSDQPKVESAGPERENRRATVRRAD